MTGSDSTDAFIPLRNTPRLKLLLVDDSELALQKLERLVISYGWSIAGKARDGIEAMHLFETLHSQIDLVLLDIQMPLLDGVECLKRMLELAPETKVVMVSASAQIETVTAAIQHGAKGYIVKPYDRKKVLDTLMKITGTRS